MPLRTRPTAPAFLLAALVLAGLGLRAFHYARNPSLWHDEAVVLLNVLGRGYAGLWGRLDFAEASPPLFLCAEKAVGGVLGESPFAWRLVPFAASSAALLLVAWGARRILPATAAAWAVFLVAFSDRALWHCCEAKPYAVDLFCAAAVLALWCATADWTQARRLLLFAGIAPLAIFLSYPAVFVFGGSALAFLPTVARQRNARSLLCYGVLAACVAGSFTLLALGPVRAQRCDALMDYWSRQLPPWERPVLVPWWVVASTFEMLRYCAKPIGGLLAPLAVAGAVSLWRAGRRDLLCLLTAPVGLALAAALVRHYPYGHARTMLFALPGVAVLTAAGVPPALAWLGARVRPAPAALALLLLAPVALAAWRVAVPWDRPDSAAAAAYVLSQRSSADAVAGSHWEHQYYFRALGRRFAYLTSDAVIGCRPPCPDQLLRRRGTDVEFVDGTPAASAPRMWLVTEGADAATRALALPELTRAGWDVAGRCERFERTSVFLLERRTAQPLAARAAACCTRPGAW